MANTPEHDESLQEMGFLSHLIELRDRLLRMVIAIGIGFVVLFPFASELYTALSGPLLSQLPEGSTMIATGVAAPFLTPFKLVLLLSIVLTVPVLLHQVWSFIAPGLYSHEKRLALPLLVSSVLLFYLGMAFAYFVVFPLVFGFFTSVAPEGVTVTPDITSYLDFVITLFLAFGVAFEVPIATILLIATGMTTAAKLKEMRPYIVVAAFVIGMLLTPPDVISQVLLAVPMWLLFELGLVLSKVLLKPRPETDAAEGTDADEQGAMAAAAPMSPRETAVATSLAAEPVAGLSDSDMDAELDQAIADDEQLKRSADDAGQSGPKPDSDRPEAR